MSLHVQFFFCLSTCKRKIKKLVFCIRLPDRHTTIAACTLLPPLDLIFIYHYNTNVIVSSVGIYFRIMIWLRSLSTKTVPLPFAPIHLSARSQILSISISANIISFFFPPDIILTDSFTSSVLLERLVTTTSIVTIST